MSYIPPPVTSEGILLARRLGMHILARSIAERFHVLETTRLHSTSRISVNEYRRLVWPKGRMS